MVSPDSLESVIQKELGRVYLCTLDELCALLPSFSPEEVVAVVERMTQEGAIACRTSEPSRSILWLPPTRRGRRTFEEATPEGPENKDHTRLAYDTWTAATSSLSNR